MTPELGHRGSVQFVVNTMACYGPVSRDGDPEEPGRVLDRECMVGLRVRYEGCIVIGSNGCLPLSKSIESSET